MTKVQDTTCCPPLLEAPLSEADAATTAKAFAALADPVRLRLLSLVAAADEVCSCNLMEPLGKSQPTISHHTKALAEAGLIVGEKRGRWTWWRVVPERLAEIRAVLA
ncbi:MAG: transcriptional regulator [Actinomycetia bacterium]|nr:transcriptional regulator [Actinomycetes bacterium]